VYVVAGLRTNQELNGKRVRLVKQDANATNRMVVEILDAGNKTVSCHVQNLHEVRNQSDIQEVAPGLEDMLDNLSRLTAEDKEAVPEGSLEPMIRLALCKLEVLSAQKLIFSQTSDPNGAVYLSKAQQHEVAVKHSLKRLTARYKFAYELDKRWRALVFDYRPRMRVEQLSSLQSFPVDSGLEPLTLQYPLPDEPLSARLLLAEGIEADTSHLEPAVANAFRGMFFSRHEHAFMTSFVDLARTKNSVETMLHEYEAFLHACGIEGGLAESVASDGAKELTSRLAAEFR
jgi:hypothetical protein